MTKLSALNNKLFIGIFVFIFVLIGISTVSTNAQTKNKKRALIISLDGLDTNYLHKADEYKLKIPTLRRLMANGVTARGMTSVYPSITYPNHTSLVTGAMPSKHGIFGNGVFEPPVGTRTGESHWFAKDIRVDTIWDAASRAGMTTGMVSFPVAGGAGDWNIPEIWKPGGTVEESRQVIAEYARPRGLVEEVEAKFPGIYKNTNSDEGDDARTTFAEYIISEKRPDVMLVHLYDLDHFQHDFGPFTPEVFEILEKTDAYVARLLAAVEKGGTLRDTTVFITSDHGFKPISKQINPGVLLNRAGLLTSKTEKDEDGRELTTFTDWQAAVYTTGAASAIYLKDPNDKAAMKKLLEIFKPLEKDPNSGIYKVLEQKDIKKINSNTRAAIMLEAADGYTFSSDYTGEFITNSRSRGMHGYLPNRENYYASFIASGNHISRRGMIDYLNVTDAGSTIASFLGLKLKNATGRIVKLQKYD